MRQRVSAAVLLLAMATVAVASARPLAFPGAEGFGRYAAGGRGGEVYRVTVLSDSGPGSFRDAVSAPGRTVVFDVGGSIVLESPVSVASRITLAGQTAPGDGIAILGGPVSFSHAEDVIVRYLRFRMGLAGRKGKDAVGVFNGHTMVFDHVSVSWGRDENFSITGDSRDMTISDSIIAEGLQPHSCGGLIQADGISILRTLYINNHTRNPKVKGRNQFVNNVVTNWAVAAYIEGDSAGKSGANVVGNVFIAGPESKAPPFTRGNENFSIYAAGNVFDGDRDGVFAPRLLEREDYGVVTWEDAPLPYPPARVLSPDAALRQVAEQAGCSLRRDTVDARLVSQLLRYGSDGKTIRDEAEVGGAGPIRGGEAMQDSDRDGMPDAWELRHGLDPKNARDGAEDADGDGYTNLEEFLNELAGDEGGSFRDFSGYCQGNGSPLLADAVGWDRHDLSWARLEPQPGAWNGDELRDWGDRLLRRRAAGVEVLPMLGYNAPWSWDRAARSWEVGDTRRDVTPRTDGRFDVRTSRRNGDGEWTIAGTEIVPGHDRWPLAAEHSGAWEEYVRRAVTFLRAEPYGVTYFQIWNEAHPRSGFWEGDLDAYMTRVHLPASRIIRELGGKVVYGGWPCCGSIREYADMLDRHDAWNSIDVHDMHYFPPVAFEHLQQAADERGLGTLAIWQTELGFKTQKSFIAEDYPRFLQWCLRDGRWQPDRYKLFFFACWTPDDPKSYGYGKCLLHGEALADHGRSLVALARLLEGGTPRPVSGIAPADGAEGDSCEAFAVRNRVVVAVHAAERESDRLRLNCAWPAAADIAEAFRVDVVGNRLPLVPVAADPGPGTVLDIPVREPEGSPVADWFEGRPLRTFYVEIRLREGVRSIGGTRVP